MDLRVPETSEVLPGSRLVGERADRRENGDQGELGTSLTEKGNGQSGRKHKFFSYLLSCVLLPLMGSRTVPHRFLKVTVDVALADILSPKL